MSAKTSLTIVCASKGSNQPRETCCQFCYSPLKAMNTGVVTKLATSHGERLPDQMFRRWCEKRQPCVVIKVLAMSCHRAVRWHNSNSLSPALSPRFTGREGVGDPAAEVREKFRRIKPLGEIKGSAPVPGAASDALVAGIRAAAIDFDSLRQPRSGSARGRAERQPGRLCSPFHPRTGKTSPR